MKRSLWSVACTGLVLAVLLANSAGATAAPPVKSATGQPCTILGTPGNDTLTGTAKRDVICGLGGDDVIVGAGGNDVLDGGPGNDTLSGNAGNDTFVGGAGDDAMDGGDGEDTVTYGPLAGPVTLDLSTTAAQDTGAAGLDALTGIEDATGTPAADTLSGDDASNVLQGGGGDDTLRGSGGDDTLSGGPGDDTLAGGEGRDTASYADSRRAVAVDLAITDPQDTLGAGEDTLSEVENLVGGPGADTLVGDDQANQLAGGGGRDLLIGRDGDDTLLGEADQDTMYGGEAPPPAALGGLALTAAVLVLATDGNDFLNGGAAPDIMDAGTGHNVCVFTPEDLVQPNCDSTAPVASNVVAPTSVGTGSAAVPVTVSLDVTDDLAGARCVFVFLSGPSGQLIQNGCAALTSGDALSGRYEAVLTIPRYSESGAWSVRAELGDAAENRRFVDLAAVQQTDAGDEAPPVASNVVAPTTVATDAAAVPVTVALDVTDDLAGVACVFVTLSGPSGQLIQNQCATRVSGDAISGRYEIQLTLPRYAETGTWSVNAELGDDAENRQVVHLASIEQTAPGDSTPPTVSNVVAPNSVTNGATEVPVTVRLDVTDDLAGVACVFVFLSGPSGQMVQNSCALPVAGLPGTYEIVLPLPVYAEPGSWLVKAELGDTAENRQFVDLATIAVSAA